MLFHPKSDSLKKVFAPPKKHKEERPYAPKPLKKNTSGDLADDPAIQTAIKHMDWNDETLPASKAEALPALLTDPKKATEDIKGLLHLSKAEA